MFVNESPMTARRILEEDTNMGKQAAKEVRDIQDVESPCASHIKHSLKKFVLTTLGLHEAHYLDPNV